MSGDGRKMEASTTSNSKFLVISGGSRVISVTKHNKRHEIEQKGDTLALKYGYAPRLIMWLC